MEPTAHSREDQPAALSEGRRIYLGNLLYSVKPSEIEQTLADQGFGDYEQIHLSLDPVSGRNPGYCFVDFAERAVAEEALASLSASIRGRPLKVGPCHPKQPRTASRWGSSSSSGGGGGSYRDSRADSREDSRGRPDGPAGFQRWGNWKRRDPDEGEGEGEGGEEQGPRAALDHFEGTRARAEFTRLYIGGLGKMVDQDQNHAEMSALLAGCNPTAIGKRITAHESTWAKPGNHNYCFVDFATAADADSALEALNGKDHDGGVLRVSHARGSPERTKQPYGTDAKYAPRVTVEERGAPPRRALASSNWRRRDN